LVAAAKVLVAATKKIFVAPNFVAETKPFFFRATYVAGNTRRGRFKWLISFLVSKFLGI